MPTNNDFWKKAMLFLAKFFIVYLVLQYLILLAPLDGLKNGIAATEAMLLGVEADGNILSLNGHAFEIVANCTGLVGISVLAAIIFSLKKPELRKKAVLFAIGAAILFPLNIVRVYLVLLVASAVNPGMAETLHIATWFATSALIILVWYSLTKKIAEVKEFSELL